MVANLKITIDDCFEQETQLFLAVLSEDTGKVAKLLKSGSNPNKPGATGTLPLNQAASSGNLKMMKLLLKNGADPNKVDEAIGLTPLTAAIAFGTEEAVRLLIEYGADPSKKDKTGAKPLDYAALKGLTEIEKLLKIRPQKKAQKKRSPQP